MGASHGQVDLEAMDHMCLLSSSRQSSACLELCLGGGRGEEARAVHGLQMLCAVAIGLEGPRVQQQGVVSLPLQYIWTVD